jgi:hypothetical protein
MLAGDPLPGRRGRFLHSATMTFAPYDIAAGAAPLHTPHSVRPRGPCPAIIAEHPVRPNLPGVTPPG